MRAGRSNLEGMLPLLESRIDFKRIFIGREFRPVQPQFWMALKFSVPERGLAGRFRRLLRIDLILIVAGRKKANHFQQHN